MLPRTIGDVYRNVREFVVAVDEQDRVIGCGGLRVYSPVMGEIIALAVDERCHGQGVGRQIVETLLEQAHAMDMCRVFAMTLAGRFLSQAGLRNDADHGVPGEDHVRLQPLRKAGALH